MKLIIPENKKAHEVLMCTNDKVIGFGDIKLEENDKSQKVIVDLELMINTLTGLKTIGFEYICIRIENKMPIFITDDRENGGKLKGVLIAPRVYDG